MAKGRRIRPRKQKQLFVVSVEGERTEAAYLAYLQNSLQIPIKILPAKKGRSSPKDVLKRLNEEWQSRNKHTLDEYWAVVDRDSWSERQLTELRGSGFSIAISNPCFEVWILAHFELPSVKSQCRDYAVALDRYITNASNDKKLKGFQATTDQIKKAIQRMESFMDYPAGEPGPAVGRSEVCKLVRTLLVAAGHSF